ncbi:unnamed protein product [Sphenostylis stenocarpa]|uniref:PPC domain-containing protein n=1 Tax=Sphenostylis stenocarpa TaxID=92480 RepID=A0AA86SRS2_9FABA|nr:unnamed protein product [Sphenostylis stenocarpa]
MVEPSSATPLSSPPFSSSDENTSHGAIESSSRSKSPSSKRRRGRPVGSKNKPKLTLFISQDHHHAHKPIFIQVPRNSDVIGALTQFARDYQISITVLSASGSILNATLRQSHSHNSTFILHGPFNLVSLTGTCIINSPCAASSSSSSDLDFHSSFNISFCSNLGQSFIGVVGGKVVAGDDVAVAAILFSRTVKNQS